MRKTHGILSWTVLIVLMTGCGKLGGSGQQSATPHDAEASSDNDSHAAVKADGPAAAVAEFLDAVRTGNDERAAKMLSAVARQKTAALNRNVTPPASDTARFAVGKVNWVGQDGARVACTWTDNDRDGQPKTDEAVWLLRRQSDGWRIVGVAAMVFPGEDPVALNFEDPEQMLRQKQWINEEIDRRAKKEASEIQAQGKENPEKPVRR